MTTDSKRDSTIPDLQETVDSKPFPSISFRKNKRPANKLSINDIKDLALSALVSDLRRKQGAGRVALAVLELLGTLHPEREQSTTLTSTIADLLPSKVDNVSSIPPKQPRSPGGDGDNTDSSAKFSQSGLTPPVQATDETEVSEKEGE